MSGETIEQEGNPIADGAKEIRSTIGTVVNGDLSGVFPRNWQWHVGNYNLIYVIKEGSGNSHDGFYSSANMIVLTPEGDFKSGLVNQRVGNDYYAWEFEQADFQPASDLEVVKFGPQLVHDLLVQLERELSDQEDAGKIAKVVNFLAENSELYLRMLAVSKVALEGMGEVDPEFVYRDTGRPDIFEEVRQVVEALEKQQADFKIVREPDFGDINEINKKKAAIDLFMRKGDLMNQAREIASYMRALDAEKFLRKVANEMTRAGIFPGSWKDSEGIIWAGDMIHSHGKHGQRSWSLSTKGARELESGPDGSFKEFFCAEHLLEQAPEILEWVINQAARRFFAKIKIS